MKLEFLKLRYFLKGLRTLNTRVKKVHTYWEFVTLSKEEIL